MRNYSEYWKNLYISRCKEEMLSKKERREERAANAAEEAQRAYEASLMGYVGKTVREAAGKLAARLSRAENQLVGVIGATTSLVGIGALITMTQLGGVERLQQQWEDQGMSRPTQFMLQTGLLLTALAATSGGMQVAYDRGLDRGLENLLDRIIEARTDQDGN